jgi:two-component system phosphate regulon sensor histidine kinase PhoR
MKQLIHTHRHILYLLGLMSVLIINSYVLIVPMRLAILGVFGLIVLLIVDKQSSFQNELDQKIFTYEADTLKATRETNLRSKQLETIIQSITFPLILLDSKKNIAKMNQSFLELNHQSQINDLSVLHSEVQRFIDFSFLKEIDRSSQLLIDDQDYRVFSIPIFDAQRFSGMLFIFQNITEVLERERMQKRFIADASHELKTPIAAIKGMIEILNRPEFNDHLTQAEFQTQIEYEAKRMENIVSDMLHLSRLSSKHQLIQYSNFNLYDLIHELTQSYRPEFITKNIELVLNISVQQSVYSDREKLLQIMSNLISNALKYTSEGSIALTYSETDTSWSIRVKDTGQGIKEEFQSMIFDRFYRVDESRSRQTGGSGLGLAIVKTYVESLNGRIQVDSTYGQGSEFSLIFTKESLN